jgi:hypothetical protein
MTCPTCKSTYEHSVDTCTKCGFPFNGTESQKSNFIAQQILKVGHLDDAAESVKTAKRVLFIIGAVNIFSSFLNPASMLFGLVIGVGFIVFGFLVEKSPFLFLVIPLTLLVMFYLADAIFDPSTLVRGFIWKIALVTALIYAIVRVKRAEKIRKESQYLSNK